MSKWVTIASLYEPQETPRIPKSGDRFKRAYNSAEHILVQVGFPVLVSLRDGHWWSSEAIEDRGAITREVWSRVEGAAKGTFVFSDTGLPPVFEDAPTLTPLRVGDYIRTPSSTAYGTVADDDGHYRILSYCYGKEGLSRSLRLVQADRTLTHEDVSYLGIGSWEVQR